MRHHRCRLRPHRRGRLHTPACCRRSSGCWSPRCFSAAASRGREPLTEGEWAEFAAQTITPNFPDGFTVFDGQGQWRNPRTSHIVRDPTKILLIAAKRTPDLARRLSAVIDAYKARFHQQSVGLITRELLRRVLASLG